MENAPAAPASAIQSIAIDQLKPNPWNRTVFDPEAMKDLVASLKAVGVKEPLIIRPLSEGGYQIASGHRRWLAAKEAGLTEVPCYVQALSDDQVAEDNITINIQRENIPPLELARMLDRYIKQFKKTQEEAAQTFGKTRTWASELLGYLPLAEGVLKDVGTPTLGWDQLRAIKAASPEAQTQLAKELKEGTLKQNKVAKRCNQLRFEAGKVASPHASLADPLATFWPSLTINPAVAPINSWKISYGSLGWNFWLSSNTPTPKATIKRWLLALADAIGDTTQEEAHANKAMDALALTDKAEIGRAQQEQKNLRLPKTPEEWADVETKASQGPSAVCAWALGENSLMAQKAKPLNWADLGETDPVAGCHKLIDALGEMQEYDSPRNPPAPEAMDGHVPNVIKEGASQIATDLAKNLLKGLF